MTANGDADVAEEALSSGDAPPDDALVLDEHGEPIVRKPNAKWQADLAK